MNNRIFKAVLLVLFSAALVVCLLLLPDKSSAGSMPAAVTEQPQAELTLPSISGKLCLGLPVVDREQLSSLSESSLPDISKLLYNGEKAPVDVESKTVYISQSGSTVNDCNELKGKLSFSDGSAALCFVDSPELSNISQAIKSGSTLTMAAVIGQEYSCWNVVLTSLPVVRVDGVFQKYGEYTGKDIMSGRMGLWRGEETVASDLLWHYRGFGSLDRPKKSIKMTLMQDRTDNQHLDLLGLGADDDWILNAMGLDDLKRREKFGMQLWNQGFAPEEHNYKMSEGEYVEVVLNGNYQGLYMLQRRVDQKYLELNLDKDVLFKGRIGYNVIAYLYEMKYSPYSENASFTYFDSVLKDLGSHNVDLANYVDINLYINYLAADDSMCETNMYYIIRDAAEKPVLNMLPWDTDVSLGSILIRTLDYAAASERIFLRHDYPQLSEKIPELDEMMAERWFELRQTVLSEENVERLLTCSQEQIASWDAVMVRDEQAWGLFFSGQDSMEQLRQFCLDRLQILDKYYKNNTTVN